MNAPPCPTSMTAPAHTPPPLFGRRVRHIHCVGVGGMGLGPLAIYLASLGFLVSGEDDALGEEMAHHLAHAGVRMTVLPDECDLVVFSSAIAAQHPATRRAQERGVPLVRRGELLAEVTRDRKLVAVCGSHGKTTTTAMLVTALRESGFPAGFVLGGLFGDGSAPARAGTNEWVVAEIDESDGTIQRFSPTLTVAVNLDWDHPDQYRTAAELEHAFAALFSRTRDAVLLSAECPVSERVALLPAAGDTPRHRFGETGDYPVAVAGPGFPVPVTCGGRFVLRTAVVRARGRFNLRNAAAALAAAELMGARLSSGALKNFPSVRRRQGVLLADDITVIEDYAHHPTEIRALLASLREQMVAPGRLIVVFQPHRYSRTAQFRNEFAEALTAADRLYLLDVYAAGEAPLPGGTTGEVYARVREIAPGLPVQHGRGAAATLLAALMRDVTPGDCIAFVGAGDIDRVARDWVARREPKQPTAWERYCDAVQPQLSPGSRLKREEPLASKTTLRVGGAARLYAEPAGREDLQVLLREAVQRRIAIHPLGRGSNLVVPDSGVDGLVISLAHEAWSRFEPRDDGRVWVGAGLRLKNLCGLAAKAGLTGFEFLEGIPASVGGALRMNAGAMGGWTFDVVEEVQLMTLDGQVRNLPRAAMHVDYRHCAELQDAIALGALLKPASRTDLASVRLQMDQYAKKRHESQPREPSAGCIFKNPAGTSAGRLIDECGLKGWRVGDAEVSPVHANFIVNRGAATAGDVIELVRRIRAAVGERRGVELEPEAILYGSQWKDVL